MIGERACAPHYGCAPADLQGRESGNGSERDADQLSAASSAAAGARRCPRAGGGGQSNVATARSVGLVVAARFLSTAAVLSRATPSWPAKPKPPALPIAMSSGVNPRQSLASRSAPFDTRNLITSS